MTNGGDDMEDSVGVGAAGGRFGRRSSGGGRAVCSSTWCVVTQREGCLKLHRIARDSAACAQAVVDADGVAVVDPRWEIRIQCI